MIFLAQDRTGLVGLSRITGIEPEVMGFLFW